MGNKSEDSAKKVLSNCFALKEEAKFDSSVMVPSHRLMLAVLEEALTTFQRGLNYTSAENLRRYDEVDQWLSSDETDSPFTFINICRSLKIDEEYIRTGVRHLKHKALQKNKLSKKRSLFKRERIYDPSRWRGHIV